MTEEIHPGREDKSADCGACGASITYTSSAGGEGANLRCPSCGRDVAVEGSDPKLTEFGPGVGQSGA